MLSFLTTTTPVPTAVYTHTHTHTHNTQEFLKVTGIFSTLVVVRVSWVYQSVQSFSHVQLCATPWTAAHQASLYITNSRSLLIFMSIELVKPSNHLILCHLLLLLPSIFPSIRVFSSESVLHIRWPKYWSFSFSISLDICLYKHMSKLIKMMSVYI